MNSELFNFQVEARKNVARIVLACVFIFIICWLPRHIYQFWYYFDPGQYNMFWHLFKIFAFCLCFMNSCVNPFALYFLSDQFRRYYNRSTSACRLLLFSSFINKLAIINKKNLFLKHKNFFITSLSLAMQIYYSCIDCFWSIGSLQMVPRIHQSVTVKCSICFHTETFSEFSRILKKFVEKPNGGDFQRTSYDAQLLPIRSRSFSHSCRIVLDTFCEHNYRFKELFSSYF